MRPQRKNSKSYHDGQISSGLQETIRILAISRFIIFLLQFFSSLLLPEAPTDAYKSDYDVTKDNMTSRIVYYIIKGFSRWDSQHFLNVAKYGYRWESTLAFQPLYPFLVSLISNFIPFLSEDVAIILVGVILSNICFIISGIILHEIMTNIFLINPFTRRIAIIIFAFNPSSIFFSSLYTESLYSFLTFFGIYYLYSEPLLIKSIFISSLIFSLALLTRSNGILNIGYVGYKLLSLWMAEKLTNRKFIITLICSFFLITFPLRIYEYMIERKFCFTQPLTNVSSTIISSKYIYPGDIENLAWCSRTNTYIPSLLMPSFYSTIQKKYWDVGLFSYWQFKKIPNFLLATPTIIYIFYATRFVLLKHINIKTNTIIFPIRSLLPFSLHSTFLSIAAIFIYNVEISIRMLYSSTPFLPISLALLFSNFLKQRCYNFPFDLIWNENFISVLFSFNIFLFIFGTICHCIWLPYV